MKFNALPDTFAQEVHYSAFLLAFQEIVNNRPLIAAMIPNVQLIFLFCFSMKILSVLEAKRQLDSLIDAVNVPDADPICITVNGKNVAVLLSFAAYERMRQTLLDQEIDALFKDFNDLNVALSHR